MISRSEICREGIHHCGEPRIRRLETTLQHRARTQHLRHGQQRTHGCSSSAPSRIRQSGSHAHWRRRALPPQSPCSSSARTSSSTNVRVVGLHVEARGACCPSVPARASRREPMPNSAISPDVGPAQRPPYRSTRVGSSLCRSFGECRAAGATASQSAVACWSLAGQEEHGQSQQPNRVCDSSIQPRMSWVARAARSSKRR